MSFRSVYRSPQFLAGVAVLLLALAPVFAGMFLSTPEMADVYAGMPAQPPGAEHLLGTQSEGRDMLALLMLATPATLTVGFLGGGIAVVIGLVLGFTSGYFGGRFDSVTSTITDIGLTIPPLAVLILIAATFPVVSVATMGLIVALTAWMIVTRVIRAQVLTISQREYIKVAKLSGMSDLEIIALEIFPNLIPFIASTFVNAVTSAILAAIGLEVLGLGPKNSYTLGRVIYDSIYYSAMSRGMWWWWVSPIAILMLVFCGLFLISIALDRFANPKSETVA
jgi:peptide/nickel transport system permease protein